jgi:hypothetical protein
MRRIIEVIPKENYILEIKLSNQHTILCDMRTRLEGIRFGGLKDYNRFMDFEIVEDQSIKWSAFCELSLDEILSMLEK